MAAGRRGLEFRMAQQDKVKVTQQTSFPNSSPGDVTPVPARVPPVAPQTAAASSAMPPGGGELPPRRILVINDDGIESPGLWAAVRALRRLAPVFVVAPSRQQSGVGASLTLHEAIGVRPWPLPPEFAAPSAAAAPALTPGGDASPDAAAASRPAPGGNASPDTTAPSTPAPGGDASPHPAAPSAPTPGGSASPHTAAPSAPAPGGSAPPDTAAPSDPAPGGGASPHTAAAPGPAPGGSESPHPAAPSGPAPGGSASPDTAAVLHPVVALVADGTPGDCCILALESLVGRVGLVVSGVNSGSNVGWDVMVSGTVGGAVQAFIRGCSTIAISVGSVTAPRYDAAEPLLERLGRELLERTAPPLFLNVNLPNLPPDRLAGVRLTQGGGLSYRESVRLESGGGADDAERRYRIARNLPGHRPPAADSDIQALRDNCVSITPLRLGLGDEALAAALELGIFN